MKPNVLLILADDLGWMDTSLYGSRYYRTPNIDALMRSGVRYTDAYSANPLCSPTRASILTGMYPTRFGFTAPNGHLAQEVLTPSMPKQAPPRFRAVQAPSSTRLPLEAVTLAEMFKQAGYATAHFGKWHLGWPPYDQKAQGFDTVAPGGSYPGPPSFLSPWKMRDYADGAPGEHIDNRLTTEAEHFLEANRDAPWFMAFWTFSVHAPFQAEAARIEAERSRVPSSGDQRNPIMSAMIGAMDDAIGRLMLALDRLELTANTIVLFVSDNGGNMYDRVEGMPPTNNAPLRSGKGNIYDGGVRVPMSISWPGRVPPGRVSSERVMSIDIAPTLLELARIRQPAGVRFDGFSLAPTLHGKPLKPRTLHVHFPHYVPATGNLPACAAYQDQWKLIRFFADNPDQSDRLELYDLRRDPGETVNLASRQPGQVSAMNKSIDIFLRQTGALTPFANPNYQYRLREQP